jgi:hypothetical protein
MPAMEPNDQASGGRMVEELDPRVRAILEEHEAAVERLTRRTHRRLAAVRAAIAAEARAHVPHPEPSPHRPAGSHPLD